MEGRRGALDLSEEIELCGKLRNDIGKALKTDAHNAAKAQSECEESKALESLIETEALHLEENVATAETSFLHATASIEKIEVATAHLHETNSVLSQQLDRSLQLIDESTEAFEELRRQHLSFCQVQEEAHKRMTSVEALLRSIMNGEEQTRGLKAEMQTLKSTLEVLERTKEELIPVLESCEKAFESVQVEYEQSKRSNAQHLALIERCMEEEEQMKAKMREIRDEHTQLCERKAAIEAEAARVQSAVMAEVEIAAQQQREAVEKHEKGSRVLEEKKRARQDQEVKLNSLKEEMQKATEEMYSTMERMKSLRKQDAELVHNKRKVSEMLKNEQGIFSELKKREHCIVEFSSAQQKAANVTEALQKEEEKLAALCGMLEMARMEQTEMDALRENEKRIMNKGLEALQKAEREADEVAGAGEELKGLIGALEAILTEQKETTHSLILSRSRVDLQLKEADIAESRLSDLRRAHAAFTNQVKEKESEREKAEIRITQLQGETSKQKLELGNLEQEHTEAQTVISPFIILHFFTSICVSTEQNLEGLEAKIAEAQENEKAEKNDLQIELFRLREELQTKYDAACAQVRVEYQCQYTAMLNQTLKDEEGRLAEEKRSKIEQISALVERTAGKMAEINTDRSIYD